MVSSPTAALPASAPSRSTVTRSQICITSSRRWVTNTTAMPRPFSPRTIANSRCTSLSDRAEVGSSMTTSFASIDSARAISTICCSATDRSETSRRGSTASPTSAASAAVRRCSSPQSTRPPRVGSRPMNTFSATDKVGIRLNSW